MIGNVDLNVASHNESESEEAAVQAATARHAAVLFDLSHRGQIELAGPDAAALLHNLSTNDIKNLPAGRGCEFFLTTNKARVVAHGFVHRLLPVTPPGLWLDLDPGSASKVVAHLNHFLVSEQVEIADRSGTLAQFHLCGPHASQIMDATILSVPPLEHLQHVVLNSVRVARHNRLGLAGYDIFCPKDEAGQLRARLAGAGASHAGLEAFNILRIEAGVPEDGVDIDAERFVVEVGRTKEAICYTKGCYLGQEPIVMARDRGHLNRLLLGLKVDAPEPLPAGTKVLHNGLEVGQVTSSVWSPLVGSVIALAYIKRGSQERGTTVQTGDHAAAVTSLPFTAG
jgi:tRNA-modifying protein YgfZ